MSQEPAFLDLFYQMRDAGLVLGIEEYRLLLRAFALGYGIKDRDDLRKVCLALWVKSPQQAELFDFQFKLYWQSQEKKAEEAAARLAAAEKAAAELQAARQAAEGAGKAPAEPTPPPVVERQPAAARLESARQKLKDLYAPSTDSGPAGAAPPPTGAAGQPPAAGESFSRPFVPVVETQDEVTLAQVLQAALAGSGQMPPQRYITSGEYYPLSQRQMKQNWRYLRRMVREGPRTELNVEATIRRMAESGMLFDLVLEPRRSNRSELILLVDWDGSMTPFHMLARRLIDTAQKGGKLGRTGVYYFHDCPADFLYTDPYMVKAVTIQQLLTYLHSDQAVVLIFSDAGAARGDLDLARSAQTEQFLRRMAHGVRRLAWLNPMPQARWRGTTAADIASMVPMFELSRRGMDTAIEVLRGRVMPANMGRPR